ncbi:GGDEF domain-containing protein [Vibrio sinaloensis]|uniref:GGDEF domain-containing protein n=1 Tax=Photobacterium sp. (strain ATCC 43367) TaxID=379097 RepID=UPI0022AF9641|nr:GGDEF domain-containing protein [Vibrio sinaloensis]MCZ4294025.1 GGDEF domain-containing protein [Vibrio sinaloensis]
MEDQIIRSIIEITGQRNSVSLGHCLVATLTEMMPITSVELNHYVNNTSIVVAKVCKDPVSGELEWQYDLPAQESERHDHQRDTVTNEQVGKREFVCIYPIPICDDSSAELKVTLSRNPDKYDLLISGLAKIYRNYLVILHESERDKLTGLLNRKTLEERLSYCFQAAHQPQGEINAWVAIIDLDHFKNINDTYGHMIGDEVLLMFAQQMQHFFTEQEQLFRFGGEEFVVLLPQMDKQACFNRLDSFRRHIASFRFPQVASMTFSCGVCGITRTEYLPTILDHADSALYNAKEQGRNQICCYEGDYSNRNGNSDDDVELF